ncbi:MAG: hypothetical protein NWF03_03895 [Candidatus Bathyarchaeota archaeon]|nr:hypothetical protein [Candidatus Bathyarchaeota archaeon]
MSSNRFDKRKKTITRTFRLRQEWDNVIQDEAQKQGVSVNVLLNKILRKYSLYSRWNDRNKDISMSPRTLREILSSVETEDVITAAKKSGALDCINIVNAMGLPMNYDSFVYLITEHLGGPSFARWFQCFHHTQGNKDIFHLQHDFGQKWSIYLENYLLAFLKAITDTEATTRTYEYAVTLNVTRPRTKIFAKTTE